MKTDAQIINKYLFGLYGAGISFGWGLIGLDNKNTVKAISEGLEFIHTIPIKDAEFPHISIAYKYTEE